MPELAEVEVVRRALARWMIGAQIDAVEVLHPRPVRRHLAGAGDLRERITGARITDVVRRGKFLWLSLDDAAGPDAALLAHLGMSGQLLLQPPGAEDERHLRVRIQLRDGPDSLAGRELRFVDQRMFGGMWLSTLIPTPDGLPAGAGGVVPGEDEADTPEAPPYLAQPLLPREVAHIARDVLDPHLDVKALLRRARSRRSGVKRALLDQSLISGIGNIYADEALWACRLHYDRASDEIPAPRWRELIEASADVIRRALAQGGTSFDSLYVNVNGESGYFERELAVYGRQGEPCRRCGTRITREAFMNRSSFRCPRCQRASRSR